MTKGTVKYFNEHRGWGIISVDNADDLYVHHSRIEMEGFKTLRPGQQVTVEVAPGEPRSEARSVRPVS